MDAISHKGSRLSWNYSKCLNTAASEWWIHLNDFIGWKQDVSVMTLSLVNSGQWALISKWRIRSPTLRETFNLTVNLSTGEVIRRYLSFSAPHGVISDLSALLWSSSSGEMDLLLPIKERVREWNLTSDVLSWLTEAWQRRSGLSFSGGQTDEYEDELPLWLSPTFYESHLSGLCFFASKLHNHIRTLPNRSWQHSTALPASLLSVKAVTYAIWLFWSYTVKADWLWMDLSDAHRCSQMWNVLFLLSYLTTIACWHIQDEASTVTWRILSRGFFNFIFIFILTWDHLYLRYNNGV